jgi:hypothetical protein
VREVVTQSIPARNTTELVLRIGLQFVFLNPNHMNDSTTNSPRKPTVERFFYSAAAVLLLVLTVVGFQLFYFHGQAYPGRPLTPPIKTLIISHGVAMSLWILLSVVQPFLIASGHRRVHMALGRVAAGIAVVLVVLGFKLGVAAARVAPPDMIMGDMTPKQFMAVPVLDILLFALFVTAGVWWRKRPDIHRPMMFLATLAAVGAAIARIDFFNHLYAGTVWQKLFGDFFFTVVVGGLFLIAKCIAFRKFDRWFAAGYSALTIWFLLIAHGAKTTVWDGIASFLLR